MDDLGHTTSSLLEKPCLRGASKLGRERIPMGALDKLDIFHLGLSTMVGLCGWYYPRYLIAHEKDIVNREAPFQKTAAGDIILDFELSEQLVDPPTISSSFLTYTAVFVPLFAMVGIGFICLSPQISRVQELHASLCGFSMTIGLSEGTTQLLKLAIQRRRPNFYALCRWDTKLLKCTASLDRLRDANFSFPSGHSSLTCSGMTFLVWYCLGKVDLVVGRRQGGAIRFWLSLASCIIPWGWTLFVATSRLLDHWHHPSDILAGLALGSIASTIVYHLWYPSLWSSNAGIPIGIRGGLDPKLPSFND